MRRNVILTAVFLLGAGLLGPAMAQDTEPPVIEVTQGGVPLVDGSLFNAPVTPVIQVTDSSPVTTAADLDGGAYVSGTPISGDGIHTLTVSATDDAGNNAVLALSFEIDTVAPVFGEILPAAESLLPGDSVSLEGTVTGAAAVTVDGIAATLLGDQFSAGPFSLAEGSRTWALEATDAAGNLAQISHRLVRDSLPPTVSLQQPAADAVLTASNIQAVGTVQDLHLESVTVNGVTASVTGTTFVASQVPLAEGENTLRAQAMDRAGNLAEVQRSVYLDTTPPVVEVTDPASGTVVPTAQIVVSGTVSDPHLDRVEVSGVVAALSDGAFSATVPLVLGVNTLVVRGTDILGWSSEVAVSVIRDDAAPEIHIDQPAEGAFLAGSEVVVSGTVEVEAGLTVTVNGLSAQLNGGAFSAPAIPLVEGENRLVARAVDSLGNQGAHTRLVYRDSVRPDLVSSDPAEGALALPPEARFVLTFSEPLDPTATAGVRLENSDAQTLASDVTVEGEELTLVPQQLLPSGSEVHVVLTAALTDRAGNPV
ncbi:MAG: Ig-like domain-containing protein, partial [Acidobacteria bacterium]|nr:Ig-like domain-containing protein [Acidobacteriota bacterium]